MNISCSSTEDYDNSDFTSNVSNSIGGGDPPFVAGTTDAIIYSHDGETWKIGIQESGLTPYSNIAYGNGTYIITGGSSIGETTFVSNTGINWTKYSNSIGNFNSLLFLSVFK